MNYRSFMRNRRNIAYDTRLNEARLAHMEAIRNISYDDDPENAGWFSEYTTDEWNTVSIYDEDDEVADLTERNENELYLERIGCRV